MFTKNCSLKSIIFTIFTLTSLYFSFTTPFNSAPDEYMRYDLIQYLYNYGTLPHGGDPIIRNPIWGYSYGFFPYLAGILSAIFMKITSFFTTDTHLLITSARFTSVLCGSTALIFLFKIADKIFSTTFKWVFICSIAFLPQFLYLSTYMNNDIIALMSIFIIIYYWILGTESSWNKNSIIGLSIGLSICLLSYYNAYGFILASILFYFIDCYLKRIETSKKYKIACYLTLLCFIFSGWFFIRNALLYDGDFFGLKTLATHQELYGTDLVNQKSLYEQGIPLRHMLINMYWLLDTFKSFIAFFGYMPLPVNNFIYLFYFFFFAFGLLSFIYTQFSKEEKKIMNLYQLNFNICLLIGGLTSVLLSIYRSYTNDFQPQGRYVMAMLFPLVYFTTKGFEAMPKKGKTIFLFSLCLCIIFILLFFYIMIFLNKYI